MKILYHTAFIAILAFGWTKANASIQLIRGGEHGEFTRFFLPGVPQGTALLSQDDNEIRVILPGYDYTVSTEKAMERISGNRVTQVKATAQGFTLSLNCSCGYDVSYLGSNGLIIDIRQKTFFSIPPTRAQSKSIPASAVSPGIELGTKPVSPAIPWVTERKRNINDPYFNQVYLRQNLGERKPQSVSESGEGDPTGIAESLNKSLSELGLAVHHPGDIEPQVISKAQETTCASLNLRPERWGYGDNLFDELSGARRLSDERQEQRLASDLELAKVYISFGMAIEAQSVLDSNPVKSLEKQHLSDLSQVVLGIYPLDEQTELAMSCATGANLWSILIGQEHTVLSDEQLMAITRDFLLLPKYLRLKLAERMKEQFLKIGANELVKVIEANITNTDGMIARREIRSDRLGGGELAEVISRAIKYEGYVPEPVMELSESTLFSTVEEAEIAELVTSRFDAAVNAKKLRLAKEIMKNEVSDTTLANYMVNKLMIEAASYADDATFLDIAYSHNARDLSLQASGARSKRLEKLGFGTSYRDPTSTPESGGLEIPPPDVVKKSLSEIDNQIKRAHEINERLYSLIAEEN